jgi:hypothetical protein
MENLVFHQVESPNYTPWTSTTRHQSSFHNIGVVGWWGGDIKNRFQSRDVLERTADEIDGNFLRLGILNGNINTRRPPIEKHPHRIHRTIRKRRTHTILSKCPRVPGPQRQLRLGGGKARGVLDGDV